MGGQLVGCFFFYSWRGKQSEDGEFFPQNIFPTCVATFMPHVLNLTFLIKFKNTFICLILFQFSISILLDTTTSSPPLQCTRLNKCSTVNFFLGLFLSFFLDDFFFFFLTTFFFLCCCCCCCCCCNEVNLGPMELLL